MSSLSISIEFITGRCVAASVSDRDKPEWPPHPGRVFMALSAACFEMDEIEDEVGALQWLEGLGSPDIYASDSSERSPVKFYVPVNDKMTVNKSVLQSTPGLTRSKQERSYPTSIPFDPVVTYSWRDAVGCESHLKQLANICSNVVRVGHSSSLVRAWATLGQFYSEDEKSSRFRWRPASRNSEIRVRISGEGELDRLRVACNADQIHKFGELQFEIESTSGKTQKIAKESFQSAFGIPYKNGLRPPEPTPATLGLWQGYCRNGESESTESVLSGEHFDSELLVLSKMEGPNIGIEDTLALTTRLRETAMSHCPVNPPPAWLGGHDSITGKPTALPHVAFLALPFVGHEHADGHIMGLALALPNSKLVLPEVRGELLGPLLFDPQGEPKNIELKLGRLGTWTLRLEERTEPPRSLRNDTWTQPSHAWGSVTPVVLDRFPKSSAIEDRKNWEVEVRSIVSESCSHAGLPIPIEIDIGTTAWHIGVPRAYAKSRRMRTGTDSNEHVRLGDGFPTMPGRSAKPSRPQVHVFLRFEKKIHGPILIGAGRFLGYGLCKPIQPKGYAQ